MKTIDRLRMRAPVARVFEAAVSVERWPEWLPHYRWVRRLTREGDGGLVEMAAWRPFGPVKYPTWWVSEMWVDRGAPAVHYRHVRGITTGMDVVWQISSAGDQTDVTIVHDWTGPRWPPTAGPEGHPRATRLTSYRPGRLAGSFFRSSRRRRCAPRARKRAGPVSRPG